MAKKKATKKPAKKKGSTTQQEWKSPSDLQQEKDYNEFVSLVKKSESHYQLDRIEARLEFPKFIEEHGKEQCDEWFERLKQEEPLI